MNNFKEIAEKCLKGELSGKFILRNESRINSNLLSRIDNKALPYNLCGYSYYSNGNYLSSSISDIDVVNFIPDMEERNVKLTLEKAKEWYKKGGELKEVALQAYTEKELKDSKPRNWKEYCENMKGKEGWFVDINSDINSFNYLSDCLARPDTDRNLLPTEEYAKAFRAYMQLISLRQAWIEDWKPDWKNDCKAKFCIAYEYGNIRIWKYCHTERSLSFPTQEMAEEFVHCFQDLLEEAKPLI